MKIKTFLRHSSKIFLFLKCFIFEKTVFEVNNISYNFCVGFFVTWKFFKNFICKYYIYIMSAPPSPISNTSHISVTSTLIYGFFFDIYVYIGCNNVYDLW